MCIDSLELLHKELCDLFVINDDDVLIVVLFCRFGEVIGTKYNDLPIHDENLVMHLPVVAINADIQSYLTERIIFSS